MLESMCRQRPDSRRAPHCMLNKPFAAESLSTPEQAERCYELGMILLRHGRADEAASMFQRGAAGARGDPRLLRDMSAAYLSARRYADALQLLFDLLREDPDDRDTLLRLGDCYLAAGDGEGADEFYQRAQSLSPDSARIASRRALAAEAPAGGPADWLAESGAPLGKRAVRDLFTRLDSPAAEPPLPPDLRYAVALLDEVLRAPDPASIVRTRLGEVLASLPHLITLTANQAEHEGRLHHAQVLLELAERAAA